MIPYKRPTAPENARTLFDYITLHHEQFCRTDDPDKKSEALRLLKGYATEYLNQVPHSQKFKTVAVERVLTQSVGCYEFDPREASEAFDHLAKYGQNLLDQPWRPEFKILNLSSGYYIHNVEQYLENPHEVLIAMGYANIDDDTLQLARLPNPSFLKEVSRDCFVASQECLILSQIWDYVKSQTKNYGITAAQIYHYRMSYVGDVATIGQTICYDIYRNKHEEYLTKDKSPKQQQQQQQPASSVLQQRNGYNNYDCPVEYMVDVGEVGLKKSGDLPERELARNVLHFTQREQQENIYDPVSGEEYHTPSKNLLSPNSPSINSSSSNFAFNGDVSPAAPAPYGYSSSGHHQTNGYLNNTDRYPDAHPPDYGLPPPNTHLERRSDTRSSTSSPFIPRTVANFNKSSSFDNPGEANNSYRPISHSSSSSTSSRGQNVPKAFEQSKVSMDQIRRMPGSSDSSCLNEPDWLDLHKQSLPPKTYSNSRSSRHSSNYGNTVKSSRTAETSAAKYLQSSGAEEETQAVLRDAMEYKHGVKNFVENYKPNSIDPAPYRKNSQDGSSTAFKQNIIASNTLSNRVSSDRETTGTTSSSSGSSEAGSWGYSKLPPGQEARDSTIKYRGSNNPTISSRQSDHIPNIRPSKSVDYETENRREFSNNNSSRDVRHQPQPPTETNLDSLETVFYQKLLSPSQEYPPDSMSNLSPRGDPNLVNNDRVKYASKEISDVANKYGLPQSSSTYQAQQQQQQYSSTAKEREELPEEDNNEGWIDPHAKKRAASVEKSKARASRRGSGSSTSNPKAQQSQKPEKMDIPEAAIEVPWACPHCTYVNHTSENICGICCKSRDFSFEEEVLPTSSSSPVLKLQTNSLMRDSAPDKSQLKASSSSSYSSRDQNAQNASKSNNKVDQTATDSSSPGTIPCGVCTYLNPKTRVTCEVCEHRLRQMPD